MGSNPYFTQPIDVIAPYSYELLFLRMSLDYAAELLSQTYMARGGQLDANNYWSIRQTEIQVPFDHWPEALKMGRELTPHGFRVDWAAVAQTAHPDWSVLVIGDRYWHNGLIWRARGGVYTPSVPNAIGVSITREPEIKKLRTPPEKSRYTGSTFIGVYGSGEDRPEEESYLGRVQGENRLEAIAQWPDHPAYDFPGLQKIKAKKGPLRKRFTEDDLADAAALFGLDVFNPDFYTGRIIMLESGYPTTEPYRPAHLEALRDEIMPGWREEHQ